MPIITMGAYRQGVFEKVTDAADECDARNDIEWLGANDWRIETYVKGD